MTDKNKPMLDFSDEDFEGAVDYILTKFIEHHDLPSTMPKPEYNVVLWLAVQRICEMMLHSMGQTKRANIIKYLENRKIEKKQKLSKEQEQRKTPNFVHTCSDKIRGMLKNRINHAKI